MPEDKAKTFPLQDYPVQFELISSKSNAPSENPISFKRIEDIFELQDAKQPLKVLLKGMYVFIFNRTAVNHYIFSTYRSRQFLEKNSNMCNIQCRLM